MSIANLDKPVYVCNECYGLFDIKGIKSTDEYKSICYRCHNNCIKKTMFNNIKGDKNEK